MLLGHQTEPLIANYYKILKSGYLKTGKETGVKRMIGDYPVSKYIFLTYFHFGEHIPYFSHALWSDASRILKRLWGINTIYFPKKVIFS